MKTFLSISLLCLASHLPVFGSEPNRPNFVFILVDDMGWTGLSTPMDPANNESQSDYYQTPHIDTLAQQGMRFSQAYAPASLCTPSRAAILTGKTPAELHMTSPGRSRVQDYQKLVAPRHIVELPKSETTIAELLKTRGYATAHFGKWHLGQIDPSSHGFDQHDGATGNDVSNNQARTNPKDVFGLTERAIGFMKKKVESSTPFYLQISHYAVHVPVEALETSKRKFNALPKGKRHRNPEYAAMTYDLDASIGILLQKIDELGIGSNTYVIFMSDNGAAGNPRSPMNLPLNGGKGSLYEGGIRVPLIVRGPSIQENYHSSIPVTGCDLLPTIASIANIDTPSGLAGTSIQTILTGNADTFERSDPALLFHYPHYGIGPRQKPQSALILGQYKLVKDLETGSVELYDLSQDLSEKKNLAKSHPEKTQELERLLNQKLETADAQSPSINTRYDPMAKQKQRKSRP